MPSVAEVWGKPGGHLWLLWTVVTTSEWWRGNSGYSPATHSAENAVNVQMIMYENVMYVKLDLKRSIKWWQGSEMGTIHVQLLSRGCYSGACTTYKRMYLVFEQVFRWFRGTVQLKISLQICFSCVWAQLVVPIHSEIWCPKDRTLIGKAGSLVFTSQYISNIWNMMSQSISDQSVSSQKMCAWKLSINFSPPSSRWCTISPMPSVDQIASIKENALHQMLT